MKVAWEVDLTRPETLVVSRPHSVMTKGSAEFVFSCTLDGETPPKGCLYQYQMVAANAAAAEVDWDSLDWLPTVGVKEKSHHIFVGDSDLTPVTDRLPTLKLVY